MIVYVSPICCTVPVAPGNRDAVSEPQRLSHRNQDPCDEVRQGGLRGETDDQRDHGGRSEDAARHRPDCRDDEQSAQHPDADDHGKDAPADDPVERQRLGAKLEALRDHPVGKVRDNQGREQHDACDDESLDPLRVHRH